MRIRRVRASFLYSLYRDVPPDLLRGIGLKGVRKVEFLDLGGRRQAGDFAPGDTHLQGAVDPGFAGDLAAKAAHLAGNGFGMFGKRLLAGGNLLGAIGTGMRRSGGIMQFEDQVDRTFIARILQGLGKFRTEFSVGHTAFLIPTISTLGGSGA